MAKLTKIEAECRHRILCSLFNWMRLPETNTRTLGSSTDAVSIGVRSLDPTRSLHVKQVDNLVIGWLFRHKFVLHVRVVIRPCFRSMFDHYLAQKTENVLFYTERPGPGFSMYSRVFITKLLSVLSQDSNPWTRSVQCFCYKVNTSGFAIKIAGQQSLNLFLQIAQNSFLFIYHFKVTVFKTLTLK